MELKAVSTDSFTVLKWLENIVAVCLNVIHSCSERIIKSLFRQTLVHLHHINGLITINKCYGCYLLIATLTGTISG